MKTAKEMFESLGYECRKSDTKIEYLWGIEYIIFWVNDHEVLAGEFGDSKNITVNEFKAIQQQMKELGWI